MRINSYPSVFALGHKAIQDIFSSDVQAEEKIDGSQFSMAKVEGELFCRSKGKELIVSAPEKMFERAVDVAEKLDLEPGWIYRCEYLLNPKHNTLNYTRTPINNLIIFDINIGLESYMNWVDKKKEADRLNLECVPLLFMGKVCGMDDLDKFLSTESILGGTTIEGVVIKNYDLYTKDKKAMMGKFVSEKFKEVNIKDFKDRNPANADIVQRLIERYRTEARWEKAVQHLKEKGLLEESPQDIGFLIKEIPNDVLKECEDEIKDTLMQYAWPKIQRSITGGLPEWYKRKLAETSFEHKHEKEGNDGKI